MTTTTEPTAGRRDDRAPGYRSVLRTPGVPAWFTVTVCQRLPIAMAPLVLVLLGKDVTGSFSAGALLAGVFALAEAAAAGGMGRRFDRRPAAPELRLVLGLQGGALLLLVGGSQLLSGPARLAAMTALAAAAGAVAAGAHGGLRALLVRSVPVASQHPALGLEATLTALMWAIGPALVAGLTIVGGPATTLVVTGLVVVAGVPAAAALRDPGPAAQPAHAPSVWHRSWPAMLHEGAVLLTVGAAFTALPPLLDRLGADADRAGLALGGFAAAGIVGGVGYGSRRWSAPYRVQTAILIGALCAAVGIGAVTGSAPLVVTMLLVGGLASTPALIARGAGLQELLPEAQWSAGFSTLYAAGGVGFGLAGLIVAPLLAAVGAHLALAGCAALAATLAAVGTVAENRLVDRPAGAVAAVPAG